MQADAQARQARARARTASAAAGPATIRLAASSTPSRCARSTASLTASAQPEIVGGEDRDAPLQAALWRSRRNWKNSTPSRSRRFIICGLRTISPMIEAIFGARK